jgi:hypothetical protein
MNIQSGCTSSDPVSWSFVANVCDRGRHCNLQNRRSGNLRRHIFLVYYHLIEVGLTMLRDRLGQYPVGLNVNRRVMVLGISG